MRTRLFTAALSFALLLPTGSLEARTLDQTLGLDQSQNAVAPQPGALMFKDPMIAGLMSATLPGLGQVYAGQRKRGLLFFIGTVSALGTAVALAEPANLDLSDYDRGVNGGNDDGLLSADEIASWENGESQDDAFDRLSGGRKAGVITSGVIGLGLYVWNIFDAKSAAKAHNEKALARRFELGLVQSGDRTGLALNINF